MKALFETTGSFMLQDPLLANEVIRHDRPTLVQPTAYFKGRVAAKMAVLHLDDVPDEFTDEQFVEILKKSKDIPTAVKAFVKLVNPPEPEASKKG